MRYAKGYFVSAVILFLTLLVNPKLSGQEHNIQHLAVAGISTPVLDNGLGFHLGYQPGIDLSNYFSVEAYAGWSHTRINGAFLSGDTGSSQSLELLIGPRIYITRQGKKYRPSIHLLAGIQYLIEKEENDAPIKEFGLGVLPGISLDINRLQLGVFLSTPGLFGIRMGYMI
jgi:hypothetical protein